MYLFQLLTMKRFVLNLLFFTVLSYSNAQICQTLTVNSTSISCNGFATGSATVSVTGGTSPYTYSWSPGGGTAATTSSLSAGVYTVRVSDAGTCIVSATVNIAQPNFFIAVNTVTNVVCYGTTFGAITYTAIGGTPGYSYTWTPYGGNSAGATGLSPGTFTLTIKDANNCVLTETATVGGPSFSLTATTTQTNNTCGNNNGGATAVVTGGSPPYTYTWSAGGGNAATATLTSGIYTVNVTDVNNCLASATVNVLQSSQFTLTSSATSVTCNGASNGSATVSVSGGTAPFGYTWTPYGGNAASASSLIAANYTVSVVDAVGCTGSKTLTITQPLALTASTLQSNILCNGGFGGATVTAAGGISPYTYTWSPSGGNAASAALPAGAYTVTIRDVNLCLLTHTFNFTQPPVLTATTSQSNILCFGAATGTAAISVGGGATPYTYSWIPSGGTGFTATGLTAGVYTVTARDNNSCTVGGTLTITQPPQIIVSAATTSILCNGQTNGSATLTVIGGVPSYAYTWSPTGGNGVTATSLPAGTYSVQVQDANGCSVTPTLAIAGPALLSSTLVPANVTCFGLNNGTAIFNVTGGITPYTYSWTPGSASTSSLSSLSPGVYSVIARDANLCASSHTFQITTPAQQTVSFASTNILCGGQNTGSAILVINGGTPAYSYTWLPSAGNTSVVSGLAAGNHTVMYSDANGCGGSQTFTITQPPALTGSVSSSAANCGNADGSATVIATGGAGTLTYSWSPSGGNTPTATAITAGQYTCTVKDPNNCQLNLVTVVAAINPSVLLTAFNNTICSTSTTTLTVTGSSSYTWSPSSSLSSSSGSVVTAFPTAATIYSVTGANIYGCIVTNTILIQLFPDPIPLLTLNAPDLCAGSTASLNASGALSYTWSPATGLNNAFISNPTATLGTALIYTVTGSDSQGCIGTNTLAVSTLSLPVITVSASATSICVNQAATLTSAGAASYTWSSGETTNLIQVTPLIPTAYVVTGAGLNGCVNTATAQLTVHPLPLVGISANTFVCQGASAVLTATGATTYNWSSGASGASLAVTPSVNSSYSVTGTDPNGCSSVANFSLLVFQTPTLTVSGKREICRNEKLTLNAAGATTYTWSTGDQTPSISYTFASNTVVTVSSGITGCPPATTSVAITVNPVPSLSVSAVSTEIRSGQSTQLNASGSATDYVWKPSEGLSCNTCADPVAGPPVTTTYTVETTGLKGCKNSAIIVIQVEQGCGNLFAPSAFSPNNDGNNDTWCIYGNCIESIQCEIFNRWGQKVFTISSKDQCWDGTINGVQQNPGSFIFQATATLSNGETRSLKGNFTLIR